jgi:hypothetical protein
MTARTLRTLLALTCGLFIVLAPLSHAALAQGLIKKGVEGVQKGVETGVDKTKEGVDATGRAIKKGVTGEDDTYTNTDTNTQRMKPQTTPGTTTPSTESQTTTRSTGTSRSAKGGAKEGQQLPKTAGELPLLALIGTLALGTAAGSRILLRAKG